MNGSLKLHLPMQPEFENNTDYYIEHKEKDIISHSNRLFYQFKLSENYDNSISIVPDGCVDILLYCSEQNGSAIIGGSALQKTALDLQANCEYFGVRFLPSLETKYLNYSMKEMTDNIMPLTDIISADYSAIERIIYERTFHKRITLFKELIGCHVFPSDSPQNAITYAVKKIYSLKGNIGIHQLAEETGYSTRYLRKQFQEHVGIPPKLFSNIVRFQHSLYMLTKRNNCTIWDVINENGYHDQAHLIKEFKKFASITPNQLSSYSTQKFEEATLKVV